MYRISVKGMGYRETKEISKSHPYEKKALWYTLEEANRTEGLRS
jgi:hypothetical protein